VARAATPLTPIPPVPDGTFREVKTGVPLQPADRVWST